MINYSSKGLFPLLETGDVSPAKASIQDLTIALNYFSNAISHVFFQENPTLNSDGENISIFYLGRGILQRQNFLLAKTTLSYNPESTSQDTEALVKKVFIRHTNGISMKQHDRLFERLNSYFTDKSVWGEK